MITFPRLRAALGLLARASLASAIAGATVVLGFRFPLPSGGPFLASGATILTRPVAASAVVEQPSIEVFGPVGYQRGQWFEVAAVVDGCKPRNWSWRASRNCKIQSAAGPVARVVCDRGEFGEITAIPRWGGCQGLQGAATVVLLDGAGTFQIQPCLSDGALPGAVVTPPAAGLYYRPGIQSTGRLNIRIFPESPGEPPAKVRVCAEERP